tara:strand:- start:1595 stop:2971 length:1377 start_codon:yes stop_codon:yes gene_type:complete
MDTEYNQIQKLYIAYFGRPADPSGINYWLTNVKNGTHLRDISKSLASQLEYKKSIRFEKPFDSQVNQIYFNLFGRKADFEVVNAWIFLIEKGTDTISDLIYDLTSLEFEPEVNHRDQFEKDCQTLENKVKAASLFTQEVSSSISWINLYQPESIDPWITGKALNKGISFLSQFDCNNVASLENVLEALKSISLKSFEILKDPIIQLNNVSLKIPIHCPENRKFTKIITGSMLNTVIGGNLIHRNKKTNIEALKNINLTIMNGERVALIGHNGSGKSSFLRLLSGIYSPTKGQIFKNVEVYPMLQKTFLTSIELSGIDASKAYYLMINSDLKGFDSFLEDIVSFSGLGSFINLPIKTYSEGMCARLIFSMLTSYPHECLVIDEGFGTGDADFFERAQKRMQSFMDSSTTLILASHSEMLLKQFCFRGIVFNHGSIVYDGAIDAALNYYHTNDYQQNAAK